MRLAATLLIGLFLGVMPAAAHAATWRAPVPGAVARGFEPGPPYVGGHHRGADFAAAPGSAVRAACGGRVVVARTVGSSGGVVTVRCGRWRVSHLPLATIAVRAGARVARGARVGTAARRAAHAGIHLGVRREGRSFAYVDPLHFIRAQPGQPPGLGPAPRGRRPVRQPPSHRPAPARPPAQRPALAPQRTGSGALAPWPAWLGLALLLAGSAGAGAGVRRRQRAALAPRVRAARAG
jgi:hypothetical protein